MKITTRPVVWVPPIVGTEYSQRLLRGIARFRNENRDWALTYSPLSYATPLPSNLVGALVWTHDSSELHALAARVPCVQLSNATPHLEVTAVTADDEMVGRRAAEHFLERKIQSFVFAGPEQIQYAKERRNGFRATILDTLPDAPLTSFFFSNQKADIDETRLDALLRVLGEFPRPWGMLCADDWCARSILECIRSRNISVPGELAVLGVNNETHVCEISDTPVSSVDLPAEEIGYRAAWTLDRMIHGEHTRPVHTRIPVHHIVTRRSTQVHAVSDPVVSKALSLLQAAASGEVDLEAVARQCGVSRRVMERRFREVLKSSPHQRLLRFRVERAKSLMRSTNWSLGRIARECGFNEQKYLSVRFKQQEGISPLQWRKRDTAG